MKNLTSIISVICFITLLFIVLFKNKEVKNLKKIITEKENNTKSNAVNSDKNLEDVNIAYSLKAYDLERQILDENTLLLNDKGSKLKDVKQEDISLIFSFSHNNCDPCIDSILSAIGQIDNIPILILSEFENQNDLLPFKTARKIKFPIYNIKYADNIKFFLNEPVLYTLVSVL